MQRRSEVVKTSHYGRLTGGGGQLAVVRSNQKWSRVVRRRGEKWTAVVGLSTRDMMLQNRYSCDAECLVLYQCSYRQLFAGPLGVR